MSDLLAECDWHDSTLFLVLPEDPERIGVRLFPSRHAPSRLYVPEAEIVRTKAENAKLRELLQRLLAEYRYLRARPRKMYLQHEQRMRIIEDEMRELGVEVPNA